MSCLQCRVVCSVMLRVVLFCVHCFFVFNVMLDVEIEVEIYKWMQGYIILGV